MSRKPRGQFLYDGCYAHIISRSIRKLKIFRDSGDFGLFLNVLTELKGTGSFRVFHYCILHTHFHLVVQVLSVKEFSRCLNWLKSRYVFAFHRKYRLSGPIWCERYKSLLIENDLYLFACGKYVENNPVKAGLVKEVKNWKYSSARHYVEGIVDNLIDKYAQPALIAGIDVENAREFERGDGIGSDYYKFRLRRKLI